MSRIVCAFCIGSGKDPFGILSPRSACQVCLGRGTVELPEPHTPCRYCQGSGVNPHGSRLTCPVCWGKGAYSSLEGETETCPQCHGAGKAPLGYLPCSYCLGKEVIRR
ncbi:MAG: hypothetical protein NTV33_09275 [Coprothermobacterota bacterium]|nr:hypothetical protein [Coprothermobacterota bacterium]